MREFFDAPHRHAFFTETVKHELDKAFIPYHNTPFKYQQSELTELRKTNAVELLEQMWGKVYNKPLTARQMMKFRNDLFIIFEAGYTFYQEGVLPKGDFSEPAMVTNNLKLYLKFLSQPTAEDIMETVINVSGFEHLILVRTLPDVLAESKREPLTIEHGEQEAKDPKAGSLSPLPR